MNQTPGSVPPVRDLVLVGGGHANVQVLKKFGMNPEPGVRVTLISEHYDSPYSGMLPGCVAGVYEPREIHIDLARLARFAGARFVSARVTGVDTKTHRIEMHDRPPMAFDVLSVNTGAVPVAPFSEAIAVKPISRFIPKWLAVKASLALLNHPKIVLVGAGAGGVELAFAMSASLPDARITLVGTELLAGHNESARRKTAHRLSARGIEFRCDEVTDLADGRVTLGSGDTLEAEEVFWVTGVQAPDWLRDSGLPVDGGGFVEVDAHLRVVGNANVFAAGDVAQLKGQERPKAGVYAVRAGGVLAHNVRAALLDGRLRSYHAQKRYLALMGDGRGGALASRGGWALEGRMMWRLKDWIDQRFINNFNQLPVMPKESIKISPALRDSLPGQDMRCGGCGAKIAAEPLRRVLKRLDVGNSPEVLLGIGDDAAQIVTSTGSQLLTIDGFRAMIDDPYLFGRIATHHSLNDIFAMGACPRTVMTLVTVPVMADAMVEEDLYQVMRGVLDVLEPHGAVLVGGHSAEGLELSIGLSVQAIAPENVIGKTGARVGDQLILTKPLGTGVALAAAMALDASPATLAAVVRGMDQSNAPALEVLSRPGVHALTDITGFGLVGHLGEMIRGSDKGVIVELDAVRAYGDAVALLNRHQSSLQEANELALADYELKGGITFADSRVRLLVDPQTSGGLLAAQDPAGVETALTDLEALGYQACVVGEVVESGYVIR